MAGRMAIVLVALVVALGTAVPGVAAPPELPTVTVELPPGVPEVPPLPEVAGIKPPVKIVTRPAASPVPAASTAPAANPPPATTAAPAGGRERGTGGPAPRRTVSDSPAATPTGSSQSAGAVAATAPPAAVRPAASAGGLGGAGSRPRGEVRSSASPLGAVGRLPLPLPVPDWSKPIILALLLAIIALAVRASLTAARARRLEAQRSSLAEDLDVLQSALVPDVPSQVSRLGVSVAYRPADGPAGGGDFYDVFELDEKRVAIILGDASGHGREALARAILTRYTLRAYVEAGLGPRAALKLAGEVLGDGEADEFTTIVVAIHDARSGTLSYATAGHPAPILIGAEAPELPALCESPPVGWGVPTGRRQTTVRLPAGARACFFSDGLTESRADGEMLGRARLAEAVSELGADTTATGVLERVRAASDHVTDDMAACLVEAREARGQAAPRVEELELDAREVDAPRVRRFLEACGVAADEIAGALEDARPIADAYGTALLHLRLEPAQVLVTVTAPESRASSGAGGGRARDDRAEALALSSSAARA